MPTRSHKDRNPAFCGAPIDGPHERHRRQPLEHIEGKADVAPLAADRAGEVRRADIPRADGAQVLAVRPGNEESERHGAEQIGGKDGDGKHNVHHRGPSPSGFTICEL